MKLKFAIHFIFSIVILTGCNKKNVQLPLIEVDGIEEIQNHSSIWIFYEASKEDTLAVLNKNNKLLNTNWVFNIDKRLTMGKIIPILEEMQENRNKDSMHKLKGMLNYFSYANVDSENISLVKFDSITFISEARKIGKYSYENSEKSIIELDITNGTYLINQERIDPDRLEYRLNNITSRDTLMNPKIMLHYPENLTYQNYLSVKALLSKLKLEVDKNEYIYTIK
jgi:biopolymer transport protein ExbD